MANRFQRPDWLDGNAARRDRAANRFKRPDWLDGNAKHRDRAANWFKRPEWMDKRGSWRDRAANTMNRPEFLDERSSRWRDWAANRLNRPEWLDRPSARRDKPGLIQRPEALDNRPEWLIRLSGARAGRFIAAGLLVFCLLIGGLALIAAPHNSTQSASPLLLSPDTTSPQAKATAAGFQSLLTTDKLVNLPATATALGSRPGDSRLWVSTLDGKVYRLTVGTNPNGTISSPTYELALDVSGQTLVDDGGAGLLGLAFAPDGGHLYLSLVDKASHNVQLVEYAVANSTVDPASRRVVMDLPHLGNNNYGASVAFGPDGYLYFTLGVGGTVADGAGYSQSLGTLAGSIMRINPRPGPNNAPYQIPPDNPFVHTPGALPELWSSGLHAGTGLAFDARTKDLWLIDPGITRENEIDRLTAATGGGKGANLGWDTVEGDLRLQGVPSPDAVRPLVTLPIDPNAPCPLSGGAFYSGRVLSEITNSYLFGDGCSNTLRTVTMSGNKVSSVLESAYLQNERVTGVGLDNNGEPIVLGSGGGVYAVSHQVVDIPALPVEVAAPVTDPPSTVKDLCGLPAAITVLSPQAFAGKPADVVKALFDTGEASIVRYRAASPPDMIVSFDKMISALVEYRKALEAAGYHLATPTSIPRLLAVGHAVATDPDFLLTKALDYQDRHCGNAVVSVKGPNSPRDAPSQ